jgi:hypothetical protein
VECVFRVAWLMSPGADLDQSKSVERLDSTRARCNADELLVVQIFQEGEEHCGLLWWDLQAKQVQKRESWVEPTNRDIRGGGGASITCILLEPRGNFASARPVLSCEQNVNYLRD